MVATRPQPVLPAWLRLWFPPVLLLIILPVRVIDPAAYRTWVDGELGFIELATPLVAAVGAVFGAMLIYRLRRLGITRLTVWTAVVTAACAYLAGEELSWGQQLIGWATPEYINEINDQHETNLHNMSSWLDQKPRLLLEIWVLVGGIIMPLREWLRGTKYTPANFRYWFWPTMDCLPTAILAILIRVPPRLKDLFDLSALPYEIRFSEPQEYYFAVFLMLYLASLYVRTGLAPPPVPTYRAAA